jgi:hypothetical protein
MTIIMLEYWYPIYEYIYFICLAYMKFIYTPFKIKRKYVFMSPLVVRVLTFGNTSAFLPIDHWTHTCCSKYSIWNMSVIYVLPSAIHNNVVVSCTKLQDLLSANITSIFTISWKLQSEIICSKINILSIMFMCTYILYWKALVLPNVRTRTTNGDINTCKHFEQQFG